MTVSTGARWAVLARRLSYEQNEQCFGAAVYGPHGDADMHAILGGSKSIAREGSGAALISSAFMDDVDRLLRDLDCGWPCDVAVDLDDGVARPGDAVRRERGADAAVDDERARSRQSCATLYPQSVAVDADADRDRS